MVLATFVFATQDVITKSLAQLLPIGQIVFVRFTAFLLFSMVLAYRSDGVLHTLRSRVPVRQFIRCLMMCGEISLFVLALRYLGVAETHALFACFPLFVAALSVPLLGEQVGIRRWSAVIIGLLGTLIILRPGTAVFNVHALIPLACAIIYALYNLLTRQVSRHDNYLTSLLWFGLVGTLASAGFALWQWQPVDHQAGMLLAMLCVASIASHTMLIKALQLTEAVVLQPFHYLVLPWVMLGGYLVYGETLDKRRLARAPASWSAAACM